MKSFESSTTVEAKGSYEPLIDSSIPVLKARKSIIPHLLQWGFNIIAATYIVCTLPFIFRKPYPSFSQPNTILNQAIQYEQQTIYAPVDPIFTGTTETINQNWYKLIETLNIKASKDDLERAGVIIEDDIMVTTDGDYVGVPAVMHQLHCLNSLRKLVYRHEVYPNMSEGMFEQALEHADHCVDIIRRTMMCKPDISLLAGRWIADLATFPNRETVTNGSRTCVKWDVLTGWMMPRVLPREGYSLMPGPFEKHAGHHMEHEHGVTA